jgi:hypothetical protein
MKIVLLILLVVGGLLITLEVGLRLLFGFGQPLIYQADQEIGYLLAPCQRTQRFGNRIEINQYGMRSPGISVNRPPATLRVLLVGDSIANGGWWTDQAHILSVLIAHQLEPLIAGTPFEQVEVLNASANSWGPRNELAYLRRFGTFEAQAVVLLLNTDDLFATAPTSVVVGRDRNYPDHKPPLALAEVISRYLFPPPEVPEIKVVNAESGDRVGFNLEAIQQIHTLANAAGAKFILAMTPLRREIGEPGPLDYELTARARLIELSKDRQITYLDFLPVFNNSDPPQNLYRDHIHLSPQGNQKVSEVMGRSLQLLLPKAIPPLNSDQ